MKYSGKLIEKRAEESSDETLLVVTEREKGRRIRAGSAGGVRRRLGGGHSWRAGYWPCSSNRGAVGWLSCRLGGSPCHSRATSRATTFAMFV